MSDSTAPGLAAAQARFHQRLERYVNGGFAARATLLLSFASPRLAYAREAGALVREYADLAPRLAAAATGPAATFVVPAYDGPNPQARAMARQLADLAPFLAGAWVHGSVATGEEIAYSDFDALVILAPAAFGSAAALARVGEALGGLRRLMFACDPLQHHGWFVLTSADLDHYCDAWFPTALLPWSRALLAHGDGRLTLRGRDSRAEYRAAFEALAAGTRERLAADLARLDAYALKGLLSQFMLLPSLYLQARDGTAVFKRESFALAAADFPAATWAPMEAASALRADWHYRASAAQRLALTRLLGTRRLATRWFAPPVPADLRARLTPELRAGAARLVEAMQARIAATRPA